MGININDLAKMLGDACYGFLALNFLWGLYNVIMGFRRVKELSFGDHEEQAEFVDDIVQQLQAGRFHEVEELTGEDPRALPQLIQLSVANRQLSYDQLRQVVMEILQRDVMGDLEYRTNWIATSIKCGPLLGSIRHRARHDGGVRAHRHRRKGAALYDRARYQHRPDLYRHGIGHGDSVQLHAGQPDDTHSSFPRCARRRPHADPRFLQGQELGTGDWGLGVGDWSQ